MKRHRKITVVVVLLLAAAAYITWAKVATSHGCPPQLVRTLGRLPGSGQWPGEPVIHGPVKEVQAIGERMSQVDRYDRKGNLVQSEISSPGTPSTKMTYSYNSKGELFVETIDPTGPFSRAWSEYSYIPEKRELVSRTYAVNKAGSNPGSSTLLGRIKSRFSGGNHPRLLSTTIFTFDASGKYISNRGISTGQPETRFTLDYDSRGRPISATGDYPGLTNRPNPKMVFRPDSKGNSTDTEVYESGKLMARCNTSYIYDRMGNWVEKHMTIRQVASGKPPTTGVYYRNISYYDGSGK